MEKKADGNTWFPSLSAIIEIVSALRHMQNDTKASNKPVIYLLLPMMFQMKDTMQKLSYGMMNMSTMQTPHILIQEFASWTISEVRKVVLDDFWIAACDAFSQHFVQRFCSIRE